MIESGHHVLDNFCDSQDGLHVFAAACKHGYRWADVVLKGGKDDKLGNGYSESLGQCLNHPGKQV